MNQKIYRYYKEQYGISGSILDLANQIEKQVADTFNRINAIREYNQLKVIRAMQKNKLSDSHFIESTGYGYGDRGREVLDAVYADVFGAEDALVRPHIVNGTHALTVCLFGILRPGDHLLSITGKPYDTLEEVIGIRGQAPGSLKEFGVTYSQVELDSEYRIDPEEVKNKIRPETRMILIQRSRGYNWRPALSIDRIEEAIRAIKSIREDIAILVDNCYGEFVEEREPTQVGADLIAGSLIKNPGGGLAPTGGYIAGKAKYVEMVAARLTTPGLGKEVGANFNINRLLFQGLFMAPHVVSESLKGAVFCAAMMKRLGFDIEPGEDDLRSDIIQSVKFDSADKLIAFCQGLQKGSPVDSHVVPEPWDMPGYDCPVIMAAGAFIQGSSIELSADAPIRPPYIAYLQGGLVYDHAKLGILTALQEMLSRNLIRL